MYFQFFHFFYFFVFSNELTQFRLKFQTFRRGQINIQCEMQEKKRANFQHNFETKIGLTFDYQIVRQDKNIDRLNFLCLFCSIYSSPKNILELE